MGMQHSIYALGLLPLEEPGGNVGTITAKIDYCTASVLNGISEPLKELGTTTNLTGSLVSVVDVHSEDVTQLLVFDKLSDMPIGTVPCRLVIGEDFYSVFLGESFNAERITHSSG